VNFFTLSQVNAPEFATIYVPFIKFTPPSPADSSEDPYKDILGQNTEEM